MNWFGSEFYQAADQLAAELAQVKERWGEKSVWWRGFPIPFHHVSVPAGATILSVSLQLWVTGGDDSDLPIHVESQRVSGPATAARDTKGKV